MNRLDIVATGHEDLACVVSPGCWSVAGKYSSYTLSNAVEHARGWVATNTGLLDMMMMMMG